ncbi:MAG: pyridoxamine 5'-phosphate oxidase family protein [Bdellovibrio sp.]|nr:pyridoxamine 5'-phosphate oxidase family protein [Bdellovibrio sp.]
MEDKTQPHSEVHKLAELIKGIKIAMLTTITRENKLHSAPLFTQEIDFDGDLWFLITRTSQKVSDINYESNVSLCYSGTGKYVSITGIAHLEDDPEKIRELWSKSYEAYFPQGPKDPNIQLLRIDVETAEYWEGHSMPVARMLQFVKATTGSHIKMGDHGQLDLKH